MPSIGPDNATKLLIRICCAMLLSVSSRSGRAEEPLQKHRPNILIFMADDQYKSSIGCYGAAPSHTPHIDRLAREGLRFTHCFTPSAICTPNRGAFLSGLLPLKNGAHANHSGFHDGIKSLPNYMRDLGYRACLVNKDGIRKPSDIYEWEFRIVESDELVPGATNPRSRRRLKALCDPLVGSMNPRG